MKTKHFKHKSNKTRPKFQVWQSNVFFLFFKNLRTNPRPQKLLIQNMELYRLLEWSFIVKDKLLKVQLIIIRTMLHLGMLDVKKVKSK